MTMRPFLFLLCLTPILPGCDRLSERLGLPDPAKVLAEGKAVGGACRHAGRGLEDCFKLNPGADKAAVYEGWKEMNEYMAKNNMQAVPPTLGEVARKAPRKKAHEEDDEAAGDEQKAEGHAEPPPDQAQAKSEPARGTDARAKGKSEH